MTPYEAIDVVQADITPMKLLEETHEMGLVEYWGAPYVFSHRVDLHDEEIWLLAIRVQADQSTYSLTETLSRMTPWRALFC